MEYGDAISPEATERAFRIAPKEMGYGRRDLHQLASEAVTDAYCVCVVAGEDAVEERTSAVHANLIEQVETRLREWLDTGRAEWVAARAKI